MSEPPTIAEQGGASFFHRDSEAEFAFRLEVRSWVEASLPPALRGLVRRPDPVALRDWHRRLHERGWIAPNWPRSAGGMGASVRQQLILDEEMVRAGAPPIVLVGLAFVGPLLIEFGTDEQKARHLPPILRGEISWAQGYSEPGAGSDLASLKTRADRHDGHFIVNGHKVWQTWGHYSDWMFTLVRTDPAAPKHAGISCLLIDMATTGVTVRPIVTITGEDELSEVFLDDVAVPADNLVGPLNEGWRVANALLAHERLAGSNPQFTMAALDRTKQIAEATGAMADAAFRDRLAKIELRVVAQAAMFEDAVRRREAGVLQPAETSILKIVATETLQAVSDLMIEAAGSHAGEAGGDGVAAAGQHFLQSRRATIFGGTREIHYGIVARRILGLR